MGNEWQRWRETHPLGPLLPLAYTLVFRMLLPSGIKWIGMLVRLLIFAACLIPAWISVGWFYLRSENIKRNVRYGSKPRNFLDIYYPDDVLAGTSAPVLIFFTGGAWIIGYKAWGALFSKTLMNMGILCVNPDYRNFPQGTVEDMLEDTDQAIEWVLKHIQNYGGDPKRVYIAGQSAGAHLGLTSILRREKETGSKKQWKVKDIRGFIGISGPYDVEEMKEHFHDRGLHRDVFAEIFKLKDKEKTISDVSPTKFIPKYCDNTTQLPPLYFFHGTKDNSCPHSSTQDVVKALRDAKVSVQIKTKYYAGKSHTDPILEDLMNDDTVHEGDLMHDICKIVHSNKMKDYVFFTTEDGYAPSPKRCRPGFLRKSEDPFNQVEPHTSQTIVSRKFLNLARKINPF